jgi:hypothetical protein
MSGADERVALRNLKTAWKGATPENGDYGEAVAELNSSQMVGEGSVFERGSHVPITHLAFFKPPATSFLSELRNKDRRSAKEWEYVNAAGVWLELGQTALSLTREGGADDGADVMSRRLALADKALEAAREVLRMRAQYFHDIVGYGVEAARQMSFLVEQGHDAVHSASHKSVRATLTQRLETEAAKMLAKTYLERASGDHARRSSSNASGSTRDGGASRAADDD